MAASEVKLKLSIDGRDFNVTVDEAGQRINKFGSNVAQAAGKASTNLQDLTSHLGAMGHAVTAAFAVGKLATMSDAYASLTARVGLASQGLGSAAVAQQRLFEIAEKSRVGVVGLSEVYTTLARAAGEMGVSQQRVLGITETLSKAMTLSGGSAESARAALVQFGQGLQTGTLRGEELNSVLEQAPRLAQALAEGLGKPVGALKGMAEQGQITTEAIFTALERMRGKIDTEFEQLPTTVGQAMTVMQNSLLKTIGVFDQAGGISRGFAEGMVSVAKNMDAAVTTFAVAGAAILVYRNSTVAATLATQGLALAQGALGGPIGLIATALGLAATAWVAWKATATHSEQAVQTQVAESDADIIKRIQGQIDKLKERNALAGAPLPKAEDQTGLDAAKRYTDAYVKFQALAANDGSTAGASESINTVMRLARNERLAQAGKDMAFAYTQYSDLADGMNKRAIQATADSRTAFMSAYSTSGEKLAKQIEDYDKQFAGKVSDSQRAIDIAAIRAAAPKGSADGTALKAQESFLNGLQKERDTLILGTQESKLHQAAALGIAGAKLTVVEVLLREMQAHKDLQKSRLNAEAEYQTQQGEINAAMVAESQAREAGRQAINDYAQSIDEQNAGINFELGLLGKIGAERDLAIARYRVEIDLKKQLEAIGANKGFTAEQKVTESALATDKAKGAFDGVALQAGLDQAKRLGLDVPTDPFKDWGSTLKAAFGSAADGMAQVLAGMSALSNSNVNYAKEIALINATKAAGAAASATDAQRRAASVAGTAELALVKQTKVAQLDAYASMASAAKGYFDKTSSAYKLLDGAEKAMHLGKMGMMAIEQGSKLANFVTEVSAAWGLSGIKVAAAGTAIATDVTLTAAGETAKAASKAPSVMMEFLSWLGPWGAAAAAVAIGAVLGGGGGSASTTFDMAAYKDSMNKGTGTVLGDATAQDNSLKNSLDILAATARPELAYTSRMVSLLHSINEGISATTSAIMLGNMDITGSKFVSSEVKGGTWYGNSTVSKTDLIGSGLTFKSQTVDEAINKLLVNKFTDVLTTTQVDVPWYNFRSSDHTLQDSKRIPDAVDSAELAGLQKSLAYMKELVVGGAQGIGASPSAIAALGKVSLNLGDINFKDADIGATLSAAFGKAGSQMIAAIAPGLDQFTLGGEGMLQTLLRVGGGVDEARYQLDKLGVESIKYTDIVRKHGDVGAEMVRQSVMAVESTKVKVADAYTTRADFMGPVTAAHPASGGTQIQIPAAYKDVLNGIGEVIKTFTGSAADLAALYTGLTQARTALVTMGFSAEVVGTQLLKGAGGIDALSQGLADYASGFLSTGEQLALKQAAMDEQFKKIGLTTPKTAADFVTLVNGLKAGGTASAELLGRVIVLSSGMKDLADALDSVGTVLAASQASVSGIMQTISAQVRGFADAVIAAEQAKKTARDAVSTGYFAAQDAMNTAQQKVTDLMATAAASTLNFTNTIEKFLNVIDPVKGPSASLESQKAQMSATAVLANAGDAKSQDGLLAQATSILAAAKASSSSRIEYNRSEAFVRNLLTSVKDTLAPPIKAAAADPLAPVVAVLTPLLVAQNELKAAQFKLIDFAALAALTGASTDRAAVSTAASTAGLLAAYQAASLGVVQAQTNNTAAQGLTASIAVNQASPINDLLDSLKALGVAQTELQLAQLAAGQSTNLMADAAKKAQTEIFALAAATGLAPDEIERILGTASNLFSDKTGLVLGAATGLFKDASGSVLSAATGVLMDLNGRVLDASGALLVNAFGQITNKAGDVFKNDIGGALIASTSVFAKTLDPLAGAITGLTTGQLETFKTTLAASGLKGDALAMALGLASGAIDAVTGKLAANGTFAVNLIGLGASLGATVTAAEGFASRLAGIVITIPTFSYTPPSVTTAPAAAATGYTGIDKGLGNTYGYGVVNADLNAAKATMTASEIYQTMVAKSVISTADVLDAMQKAGIDTSATTTASYAGIGASTGKIWGVESVVADINAAKATMSAQQIYGNMIEKASAADVRDAMTKAGLGSELPSFAVGTSFVPHDMVANIHQGEEITPRPYVDRQSASRDETNALLRELVKSNDLLKLEVATLRKSGEATAKATERTTAMFENVTKGGTAMTTA